MRKNRAVADPKFWKGKKVLITGYNGFLGSHMARTLVDYGSMVTGIDLVVKRDVSVLTEKYLAKIDRIKGSVEDYALVFRTIKSHKIEYIFHLAAISQVGECLRDPLKSFSTNIEGTCKVLEAARKSPNLKGIIVASSDKAYGSCKDLPYSEIFPMAGEHPYDVSKSCTDLISRAYYVTYGLPVCVVRCGNIFGPGDFNFARIVPDAVRSALANKTLDIRSNGKFTRDYIYIKDVVEGYLILAQKIRGAKLFGEAFNFSNEKPISVLDLVNNIFKLTGKETNYKILNQAQFEIKDQYLSARKARKMLDWKPRHTLNEGLRETIAWY